ARLLHSGWLDSVAVRHQPRLRDRQWCDRPRRRDGSWRTRGGRWHGLRQLRVWRFHRAPGQRAAGVWAGVRARWSRRLIDGGASSRTERTRPTRPVVSPAEPPPARLPGPPRPPTFAALSTGERFWAPR